MLKKVSEFCVIIDLREYITKEEWIKLPFVTCLFIITYRST